MECTPHKYYLKSCTKIYVCVDQSGSWGLISCPYTVSCLKTIHNIYLMNEMSTTLFLAPMIPSIWNVIATITDANHIPNLTIHYQVCNSKTTALIILTD